MLMLAEEDIDDDGVVPQIPDMPDLVVLSQLPLAQAGDIAGIVANIQSDVDAIGDADMALVGQWQRDRWVAAVLVKAPYGFKIKGWVADEEGAKLGYGVGVVKTFKW